MDKFTRLSSYKNKSSATVCWGKAKKRIDSILGGNDGLAAQEPKGSGGKRKVDTTDGATSNGPKGKASFKKHRAHNLDALNASAQSIPTIHTGSVLASENRTEDQRIREELAQLVAAGGPTASLGDGYSLGNWGKNENVTRDASVQHASSTTKEPVIKIEDMDGEEAGVAHGAMDEDALQQQLLLEDSVESEQISSRSIFGGPA